MSKDFHTAAGGLEEWNERLRDLLKQSIEIKDQYEAVVESEST